MEQKGAPEEFEGSSNSAASPESRAMRFFGFILKHKRWVISGFVLFALACALCIPQVHVNYNLASYLPQEANSSQALDLMEENYGAEIPNARLYAQGLTLIQASHLAESLGSIEGVNEVLWLGDQVDIQQPLEMVDESTLTSWKTGEGYLYQLTVDGDIAADALESIRQTAEAAGSTSTALSGDAVTTVSAQESTATEVAYIMLMAILIIILIISLTSNSWFESVVFLLVLAVAIIMNMGTNIFRGEISFVTQICAAVLQLAVSMDYAIVMLHTFRRYQKEYPNNAVEAMKHAMYKGFTVILSSAAVTFFGFLSLSVMSFLIGVDMGIVLAKGIFFSFLAVMFLMPCAILALLRPLEALEHKPLLPSFNRFGVWCTRLMVPLSVIIVLVAVPSYLGQSRTDFSYGAAGLTEEGSELARDQATINDAFGADETWVMLVPEGDWAAEKALTDDLKELDKVDGVISYTSTIGEQVPVEIVPEEQRAQLLSGGYSRIIIQTSLNASEGTDYDMVETVRGLGEEYYEEESYLAGTQVSEFDLKNITTGDSAKVKLFSVGAIALVLMLMFRSLSIPLIVLLPIEISIWLNLAVPYFSGQSLNYIGYLVIDAVQLGAAVDYAIIYTREYLEQRGAHRPLKAARLAISKSAITIMTSALILTIAGLSIYFIASNSLISEIGMLVGRGAFLAMIMMFTLLPLLFVAADWLIRHTSIGLRFFSEKKEGTMKQDKNHSQQKNKLGQVLSRGLAMVCVLVVTMSLLPAPALAYASDTATEADAGTDTAAMQHSTDTRPQQPANKTKVLKEEVVYGKLSSNGSLDGLFVVNSFSSSTDTIVVDPGNYSSVVNLTTEEELKTQNAQTEIHLGAEPFSYQGVLAQDVALPWNIEITYSLDKRELDFAELSGATGRLGIDISISASGKNEVFSDNYLLQGSGAFAHDTTSNLKFEQGSIATAGSTQQVTFMVIPGTDMDFHLEADVQDFSFDGFTLVGLPLSFALDLDDMDTSGREGSFSELQEAVSQIASGAAELDSNSGTVVSGLGDLSSQNDALVQGSGKIEAGILSTYEASVALAEGSSLYASGLLDQSIQAAAEAAYYESLAQQKQQEYGLSLAGAQAGLNNAELALTQAYQALAVDDSAALQTALDSLAAELSNTGSAVTGIYTSVGTQENPGLVAYQAQASAYGASAQTATSAEVAYRELDAGIHELEGALPQLVDNYALLDDGLLLYTSGVATLNEGYQVFDTGVESLAVGTESLRNETATLDQALLEGIETELQQALNPDFELHSFADETNTNVESVQFIIKTEATKEPAEEPQAQEEEKEETFWTRLMALFE